MKIRLLDWQGHSCYVEVPEDTDKIRGIILSGDMIMLEPLYRDSSRDRVYDYYDGYFVVERKDFPKLEQIVDSYQVFDLDEI